ncbi:chemotaxis protein CheW [Amycolatopsis sp. NPDC051128]|jgi:chemotaxis signal transduction protein|uniref:chemotaxis protein CheW n=1 Tax=Amycolatopsis sp. NPDC051128 TaxID=3155412 RepID=UPI003420AE9D
MTTVVCFRNAGAAYCIPVEATRAVRDVSGMVDLPSTRTNVAGIVAGDPPLTVISPLGSSGTKILVVEAGGKKFGLLVDAVTGLHWIDDADIRLAPHGQEQQLISGTIDTGGQIMMVTDPDTLAAQL